MCPQCGLVKVSAPLDYDLNRYVRIYRGVFDTDLETRINVGRVARVMKFVPLKSRVLDWGCSCGNFLARAEQYYACVGYEPATTAPSMRVCRAPIYTDPKDIEGTFGAVTMFDVVEHMPYPIEGIRSILPFVQQEGGVIIVSTPSPHNYRGTLNTYYHLWPGQHMYLWTLEALSRMMSGLGMECIYSGNDEGALRTHSQYKDDLLTAVFRRTKRS